MKEKYALSCIIRRKVTEVDNDLSEFRTFVIVNGNVNVNLNPNHKPQPLTLNP